MSRIAFIMGISMVTLLVALGLQYRQQSTPIERDGPRQSKNEPDFYLTNTSSIQYSIHGAPRSLFKADKLEHFPKGDYTLASAPDVTLFHKDGTPWHINALMGRIESDHKAIKLWNNVELRRVTPESPLLMKTKELIIEPDQKTAFTDQDVVITSNLGRVDATGMKAYFDENRMELLSNVRVRHEPIKPH